MKISHELAELCGIVLGDGYVHKSQNTVVISGSLDDYYFYKFRIVPIIKSLFATEGCIYFQKEKGACYLSINSKNAVSLLLSLGFKRGKKTYKFPKGIDRRSLYADILRGLFDTDGSIKFSRQTKSVNYYPRVRIFTSSRNFSRQIKKMLDSTGFNYSMYVDKNNRCFERAKKIVCFEISGAENFEKWMNRIGSSNIVHITKYLLWKRDGIYVPRSTLKKRLNSLNKTNTIAKEITAPWCSGQ